jgi:molybdopterin biosynthesis enzyme MoaB
MTASERAEISEDVGKILKDLLDGGSYTVRCEDLVPYKKDGIGIEIDACIDWHKIQVVFQCWPEKCKHHGRQ